jgi:hypothetical protein
MTTNNITTKASTVAVSAAIRLARTFITLSAPLHNFAYSKPPRGRLIYAVGDRFAGAALTLSDRLRSTGEALEAWAERTAERRGIDILDVLSPIVDARIG